MVRAKFYAEVSELSNVIDYINETLEKNGWEKKEMPVIDVAVEEIFVNIALYAYEKISDGESSVVVSLETFDDHVEISLEDSGIEYNPLLKEDPDVTLSAQEREIGGLGIYMVKKSMDDVTYKRVDGKNILTLKKNKSK
ncbi:MAG: ATP-binding protein [Lachnospiraceae bacterium]|nr:ATP-binding protein [Lachnospiraceae bacterium]